MKRYTEKERLEILNALEESGMSRAAFCREYGLCYGSVGRWQQLAKDKASGGTELALVEVSDGDGQCDLNSSGIVIYLPSGAYVEFGGGVSMESVNTLCRGLLR